MRGAKKLFALLASRPADRFDALDAKWFDDGARHKNGSTTKDTKVHEGKSQELSSRNVDGVFVLSVSHRRGALNFVPREGSAFRSPFHGFEQDQREDLTVREALQPDLAQQPGIFTRVWSTALQRECDCGINKVDDEEPGKENHHSLKIRRIGRFWMEVSLSKIPK